MKNKFKVIVLAHTTLLAVSLVACKDSSKSGGGKSLNSAEALKEYLDKQPANSSDKPIKVSMNANELMIGKIGKIITSAGKYVSLDLSRSSITAIQYEAFEDCVALTGIILPNGVTKIFFSGCTSLASITIPDSVTSIGFIDCTSLARVTIPDSVTRIGFNNCSSLTSVIIPDSVTSIGFYNCASLTSVTIPSSVTYLGYLAFYGCTGLTSVIFQGKIGNSHDEAFHGSGDLRRKCLAGGIETYTRPNGNSET